MDGHFLYKSFSCLLLFFKQAFIAKIDQSPNHGHKEKRFPNCDKTHIVEVEYARNRDGYNQQPQDG